MNRTRRTSDEQMSRLTDEYQIDKRTSDIQMNISRTKGHQRNRWTSGEHQMIIRGTEDDHQMNRRWSSDEQKMHRRWTDDAQMNRWYHINIRLTDPHQTSLPCTTKRPSPLRLVLETFRDSISSRGWTDEHLKNIWTSFTRKKSHYVSHYIGRGVKIYGLFSMKKWIR